MAQRAFPWWGQRAALVDELVAELAAASQKQNQGIAQVNRAMVQMDKITQGNAASAEETASSAGELNAQSHALKTAVASLLKLVQGGQSGHPTSASPSQPVASPASVSSPGRVTGRLQWPRGRPAL
jgi:methyl-accepting chemotaxis protein